MGLDVDKGTYFVPGGTDRPGNHNARQRQQPLLCIEARRSFYQLRHGEYPSSSTGGSHRHADM